MDNVTYIGVIAGHSGDAITDELHHKGYQVALVTGRNGEPGSDKADQCCVTDLSEKEKIEAFFRKNDVQCVLIGTGNLLAIELARYLEKQGFIISINFEKSLLAKDKVKFKCELKKNGFMTPKFLHFYHQYDINQILQEIHIPCVVKSSTDALQPKKANTLEELKEYIQEVLDTNTEVLIEEFVSGCDCTIAVLSDGENITNFGVVYYNKAKEYQLKGFEETYVYHLSLEQENIACSLAEELVRKLNFIGLVRVDFVINENFYILELNSIIVTGYHGSSYPFFKAKGIDIAKYTVENALKIFERKGKK